MRAARATLPSSFDYSAQGTDPSKASFALALTERLERAEREAGGAERAVE